MRRAGAIQVSLDAIEELCAIVESLALDISKASVLFADDEGRLKVTKKDVKSAIKEFLQSAAFER